MNLQINIEELNELLKSFYTLTRIRVVVFDDSFNKITGYPDYHSKFCRIIRSDKNAKMLCEKCDAEACEICQKEKKTKIYKCHAGMTEVVTPIMYGDIAIGYIMFGQLLQTQDKEKSWNEISSYISSFDVDLDAVKTAYLRRKETSIDLINSTTNIMQACAGYIYTSKMITFSSDSLISKIDNYINENLSNDLSVEIICDKFHITKTKLYEISSYCYGKGIANHIKELRLNKAKQLMNDSNKKIRDIAEECGIPDYNYFTKVFKKETGLSPRSYKKKNQ